MQLRLNVFAPSSTVLSQLSDVNLRAVRPESCYLSCFCKHAFIPSIQHLQVSGKPVTSPREAIDPARVATIPITSPTFPLPPQCHSTMSLSRSTPHEKKVTHSNAVPASNVPLSLLTLELVPDNAG